MVNYVLMIFLKNPLNEELEKLSVIDTIIYLFIYFILSQDYKQFSKTVLILN